MRNRGGELKWCSRVKDYILTGVRVILGMLFVISGISKIVDLPVFVAVLRNFGLVPDALLGPFAILIPILELCFGFLLSIGFFTRSSAAVIILLLTLFIAGIIFVLMTGKSTDCGCFGSIIIEKVDFALLFRDVILLCFTLIIFTKHSSRFSIDRLLFTGENKFYE